MTGLRASCCCLEPLRKRPNRFDANVEAGFEVTTLLGDAVSFVLVRLLRDELELDKFWVCCKSVVIGMSRNCGICI